MSVGFVHIPVPGGVAVTTQGGSIAAAPPFTDVFAGKPAIEGKTTETERFAENEEARSANAVPIA